MKSIPKLIRRLTGTLIISSVLLLLLNIILLGVIGRRYTVSHSPWAAAKEAVQALQKTEDGYILSPEASKELAEENAWAVFIDNHTLQAVWQTDNLPDKVPQAYTASSIAALTRGYIDGYPTFTSGTDEGLMVLGYPKDRFWKDMWPSWDFQLIADSPKIFLAVLAVNAVCILLIYITANARLLKSIKPIVSGIQALGTGKSVHVSEKGILSEIAASMNQTSELLQSQNNQLRRKETARANWIAGISHDIRTPLSMIMGYAGQLQSNMQLPEKSKEKAGVILKQGERIRNLINDLNLASKLEYNMQPVHKQPENAVALVRQVVVDFINTDIEEKYPLEWETGESLPACFINADKDLLKRAVSNLIQNCISHNEKGCTIHVSVQSKQGGCIICVEDDGIGISDEQIEKLNTAPHYMVCDTNTLEQRHGLGLLLVKQITASLDGTVNIGHSAYGGFRVSLTLPELI